MQIIPVYYFRYCNKKFIFFSYELFIKICGKDFPKRLLYEGSSKYLNVTNLEPYTNYSFELVANRQSKNSNRTLTSELLVQASVESMKIYEIKTDFIPFPFKSRFLSSYL